MGYYQNAQICLNGHCITSDCSLINLMQKYCDKCGAVTIEKCPSCQAKIHGDYEVPDVLCFSAEYTPPSYCHECGNPYPWTQSAIESISLLIEEEEDFSQDQKNKLVESLPDLVSETPKTNVAIVRMKKALLSAGQFTAEGIRQFTIDFGCELVKKSVGL
ncbi:DUF2321 domain-containing protein [Acetobacterium malicum]|uniref:DUF2321 domain-containing protein n=1 Tax=Acetobacterium malicum TaxID=52692 RepID=UPI0035943586